jgi:serine/threonine protein phosphatase PrpC
VICKKGLKIDTPNQDDYIVIIDPHCLIFGVFDGHGPQGHLVAHFIQTNLSQLLLSNENLHVDPELALRQAFQECSELVLNKERTELDCSISGTTATILCIFNQKAFVAHVGDSRAVLLVKNDGKVLPKTLTKDHRPDLVEEAKRIQESGGEIRKVNEGPARIFKKGLNYPGINMSRSIGDFVSREIGLISDPDVFSCEISDDFEAFVICSDGVWEFVSSQEVAEISVRCKGEPKKVAERLATFAWMQWKEKISDHVDDITVCVFYPNNSNAKELFYFL